MEALNGIYRLDFFRVPGSSVNDTIHLDQLKDQAIRICKKKLLFSKTLANRSVHHSLLFETLLPKRKAPHRNRISDLRCHTCSIFSLPHARPGKKCQNGTGRSDAVAEVKVVGLRIIKIHGLLHQAQTQYPGIKIMVPLRIASNRSDMVET